MKLRRSSLSPLLVAAACLVSAAGSLLFSSGCSIIPKPGPDPTRFFVLAEPATALADNTVTAGITLGLLPVDVPAYLGDNRALAVFSASNQITYRDFDRWAEPFDKGMARVLRGALTQSPTIARVLVTPFPVHPPRDYDLAVRVIDAAGSADGTLRFTLAYTLTTPDGTTYRSGHYTATGTAWDGDSASLARALSDALTAAATDIAAAL